MPRPLSVTVTVAPSLCSVTVIWSAASGEIFVDGIVDDLPHEVMQAARIDAADVHRRPPPHRLETFEYFDVLRAIGLAVFRGGFVRFLRRTVRFVRRRGFVLARFVGRAGVALRVFLLFAVAMC